MKQTLLLTFLILLTFSGYSTNADDVVKNSSISGKIIDKRTGEPITGVSIKLTGLDLTVYTDFDGNFSVSNVFPGKYDLTISMLTYKKVSKEKFQVSKGNQNFLKVELEPIN